MYFSVITPAEGREREAVHQRLEGPYADHQWLWRLFPAPEGTARDFLFRRHEVEALPRYYVVSQRAPANADDAWRIQTRDYDPQVEAKTALRFELRTNPSVRHGRAGKSKRHDVVMEAKKKLLAERGLAHWGDWQDGDKPALYDLVQQSCSAWLARRGQSLGFAVDTGTLIVEGYQQHAERRDRELRFSSVDFTGTLTVTDPVAFRTTLLKGIGHAKAFGFGLLLVRQLG